MSSNLPLLSSERFLDRTSFHSKAQIPKGKEHKNFASPTLSDRKMQDFQSRFPKLTPPHLPSQLKPTIKLNSAEKRLNFGSILQGNNKIPSLPSTPNSGSKPNAAAIPFNLDDSDEEMSATAGEEFPRSTKEKSAPRKLTFNDSPAPKPPILSAATKQISNFAIPFSLDDDTVMDSNDNSQISSSSSSSSAASRKRGRTKDSDSKQETPEPTVTPTKRSRNVPMTPTKSFTPPHSAFSSSSYAGSFSFNIPVEDESSNSQSPSFTPSFSASSSSSLSTPPLPSSPPDSLVRSSTARKPPDGPERIKKGKARIEVKEESPKFNTLTARSDGRYVLNDVFFRLEPIGAGKEHDVFKVLKEGDKKEVILTLTQDLGGLVQKAGSFNACHYVFKFVALKKDKNSGLTDNENIAFFDITAYNYYHKIEEKLKRFGLFLPKVLTFPDKKAEIPYSIEEMMEHNIDTSPWSLSEKSFDELDDESKKVLGFAKSILTEMANTGEHFIQDFSPRNIMTKHGRYYLVDRTYEDDDVEVDLFLPGYIRNWANGNPKIWELLISDFNAEVKKAVNERLKLWIEQANRKFPVAVNGPENE